MASRSEKWANEVATELMYKLGNVYYNTGSIGLRLYEIGEEHEFTFDLIDGELFKKLNLQFIIDGDMVVLNFIVKVEKLNSSFDTFRIINITSSRMVVTF